ncbi:unnamed protein product [Candidula unifasciata]|uniref:Mitochondrial ribosomal protein S36 n=1 Tax=Candidula unifasciata TaxID=100452 RepID=A0A8S3ZV23_9EUPU|nr:unnamed protein product [Candidula unifasciata]
MGAAAARTSSVAKIIKPHIPLIKFPLREPSPLLKEIGTPVAGKQLAPNTVINTTVANQVPSTASKRSTGSVIDSSELPQKYRRKPISKEEMEIIEKGGPV